MLLIKLSYPRPEMLSDRIIHRLPLFSWLVLCTIIITMATIFDDINGNFVCGLQRASRAILGRDGGRAPRIILAVHPHKASGIDVAPASSFLVVCMIRLSGFEAIFEAVEVREVSLTNIIDLVGRIV